LISSCASMTSVEAWVSVWISPRANSSIAFL
jgi:hypothetical protein